MSLIERAQARQRESQSEFPPRRRPEGAIDEDPIRRAQARQPLDLDLTSNIQSAFFGSGTDVRSRSARRVEERVAPPVARPATIVLDLDRLAGEGFVVPNSERSPMFEYFGQIKRPLLTNARSAKARDDRLSLVMVSSAMPREGKTFCAINLAMSMSFEVDTSVLLVDADVRRPEVLQRLGLEPRRGLLDLLTDPALTLADVVVETNVPKLSLLPAGLPSTRSSELLASDAMDALLLSLAASDTNRMVIFDTPPLLVTTEAKVLASRMGQVVMVVAASRTPQSALKEAFATVAQCPVVMSILNQARTPPIPLGYGY